MAAAANPKTKQLDPQELYELKQRALQYYAENAVPVKMEEILNSMFFENPDDVYGYLSNYFDTFSKTPLVSRITAHEVFDSRGETTIRVDVYCIIRNHEKLTSSTISPAYNSHLPDNAPLTDREVDDKERQESVLAGLNFINFLSEKFHTVDPCKQEEHDLTVYKQFCQVKEDEEAAAKEATDAQEEQDITQSKSGKIVPVTGGPRSPAAGDKKKEKDSDKKDRSNSAKAAKGKKETLAVDVPVEKVEKHAIGSSAVCSISMALCCTSAHLRNQPAYRYITDLAKKDSSKFRLPLPMLTVMQSGKAAPGKQNCIKEYMIVPSPHIPLSESISRMMAVYNQIGKILCGGGKIGAVKSGKDESPKSQKGAPPVCSLSAKYTNDIGALCPALEKSEQGLDMLKDAMAAVGLIPGEDMFIALNCPASEIIDMEKGKYEVCTGMLKSYDDTVEYYADLVSRYPIVALIDPIRKLEIDHWGKLAERISEQCLMLTQRSCSRPVDLKVEGLNAYFPISGVVLTFEGATTISDLLAASNRMATLDTEVILATTTGETTDSFLADLAVGMGARFLKLGAPVRGERVSKLNRLLQIEAELTASKEIAPTEAFEFPKLEVPHPVSPNGESIEDLQATPKKEGKKK